MYVAVIRFPDSQEDLDYKSSPSLSCQQIYHIRGASRQGGQFLKLASGWKHFTFFKITFLEKILLEICTVASKLHRRMVPEWPFRVFMVESFIKLANGKKSQSLQGGFKGRCIAQWNCWDGPSAQQFQLLSTNSNFHGPQPQLLNKQNLVILSNLLFSLKTQTYNFSLKRFPQNVADFRFSDITAVMSGQN